MWAIMWLGVLYFFDFHTTIPTLHTGRNYNYGQIKVSLLWYYITYWIKCGMAKCWYIAWGQTLYPITHILCSILYHLICTSSASCEMVAITQFCWHALQMKRTFSELFMYLYCNVYQLYSMTNLFLLRVRGTRFYHSCVSCSLLFV